MEVFLGLVQDIRIDRIILDNEDDRVYILFRQLERSV